MKNAYKSFLLFLLVSLSSVLVSCGWNGDKDYEATIRVTSYGIPHILADNWGDLGFGYGYQFASDNLCVFAKRPKKPAKQLTTRRQELGIL